MGVRHETDRWKLEEDRFGFFTLTRKGDGASAFFQGDDANLWDSNMGAIESIPRWNGEWSLDKAFEHICEGYSDILEAGEG